MNKLNAKLFYIAAYEEMFNQYLEEGMDEDEAHETAVNESSEKTEDMAAEYGDWARQQIKDERAERQWEADHE
mgnify:CR=1 FL=1|tara:strand:- start:11 stop:229 length:219 start_codon:yes stop_codon:yes gene_type:complete